LEKIEKAKVLSQISSVKLQQQVESYIQVTQEKVPEEFLCRITDDLMVDPVILSSGFTYEREAILKHF
jgi:hypothetical protein